MQIFDVSFSYERVFFFSSNVFLKGFIKRMSYCTDHLLSPPDLLVVVFGVFLVNVLFFLSLRKCQQ